MRLISGGSFWTPEGGGFGRSGHSRSVRSAGIWSAEEKAALLAEIDAEGGKVRLVARRHHISESLLYNWRSTRKAAAVAMGASENVEFIPVGVIDGPATLGPAMLALPTPEPAPQSPSAEVSTAEQNSARLAG